MEIGNLVGQRGGPLRQRANALLGSVMVLTGYAGPGRGHVGVVSQLVSAREIRIDHANWLGDRRDLSGRSRRRRERGQSVDRSEGLEPPLQILGHQNLSG